MCETNGKVSIILPVYNVEKFLPICLESVIHQTYENTEIICVDDSSPDGSVNIIKNYMKKDSRIKLISQENTGLSGARNTGLQNAEGEYVMFLDSDDWIELETCAAAVEEMQKENADLVMWSYVREFPNTQSPKQVFKADRIVFDGEEMRNTLHRRIAGLKDEELSDPSDADSAVTAWGKLYKTKILKENGCKFTDTKLVGTEDALFNLEAFCHIKKAVFINKFFNHYRKDNSVSLTRSYKPNLFDMWQELYNRMGDIINKNALPFEDALDNRIALSIIGLGLNELIDKKSAAEKIKKIKYFLSSPRYKKAYKNLKVQYMPVHWRVFFTCCKHGNAAGVYALLVCIDKIIGK